MKPSEFVALVALLEDPDYEVFNTISNKLIAEGLPLVPLLERAWENSTNDLLQSRLEDILHQIQYGNAQNLFKTWLHSGTSNLLEGALCIAKYQFPDLEYEVIDSHIDKLKQKVWLEFNESLTALEKIKVLNHVFYTVCGFRGNTDNFFDPYNHYINSVVESRKGGPVTLAILYAVIAQRLGLPVHGVSLPKNFLLAYEDKYSRREEEGQTQSNVLFYINPFTGGTILGRKEIEQFLTQNKIEQKEEYFIPCSNRTTISQLLGSLMIAYQKTGNNNAVSDLKGLLDIATSNDV